MATYRVDRYTGNLLSLIELSTEMYLKYQEVGLDTRAIEAEVNTGISSLFFEKSGSEEKTDNILKLLCVAEKRYFDSRPKHLSLKYDA